MITRISGPWPSNKKFSSPYTKIGGTLEAVARVARSYQCWSEILHEATQDNRFSPPVLDSLRGKVEGYEAVLKALSLPITLNRD